MKHQEIFTGRIGRIDDVKEFGENNCLVKFTVAETPRIKKGNEWVDGTTLWTNVTLFGDEARNLAKSVKPGTVVTVVGTRNAQEYTPKDSTEKRIVQSVTAEQVSIAITRWNYVKEIGSINYSKEGTTQTQTQPSKTSVFGGNDSDPFEDEDPFGLG